jgi:hypothetical protein
MTDAARHVVLAIGYLENLYGTMQAPSNWWYVDKEGVSRPSFNWGGVTAKPGQPYFIHSDKKADGTPTTHNFRVFDTMQDGYESFYKVWAKPDTYEAARSGDAYLTSKAMYEHGYYEGTKGTAEDRVREYGQTITDVARTVIAKALGEVPTVTMMVSSLGIKNPPPPPPPRPLGIKKSGGGAGAFALVALLVVGGLILKRK